MAQERASSSKTSTQRPQAVNKAPRKVTPAIRPQALVSKRAIKPAVSKNIKMSSAVVPIKTVRVAKSMKIRLMREKFTMLANENILLRALKVRCIKNGVTARKSDLIRAAIFCLADLEDSALLIALRRPPPIKIAKKTKNSKKG